MLHILYTQVSVVYLRNEYFDLNLSHMTIDHLPNHYIIRNHKLSVERNLKGMISPS